MRVHGRDRARRVRKDMMKIASGLAIVISLLLSGCVSNDLNAPFPTELTSLGSGRYRYVAASTTVDPAQSRGGERLRLQFLDRYFSTHNLCQKGYDIIYRNAFTQLKSRTWEGSEPDGWVTYTIQCRFPKSTD